MCLSYSSRSVAQAEFVKKHKNIIKKIRKTQFWWHVHKQILKFCGFFKKPKEWFMQNLLYRSISQNHILWFSKSVKSVNCSIDRYQNTCFLCFPIFHIFWRFSLQSVPLNSPVPNFKQKFIDDETIFFSESKNKKSIFDEKLKSARNPSNSS